MSVFTVPTLPDLSKVRVRGGDYDERALAGAVNTTSLVGDLDAALEEPRQRRAHRRLRGLGRALAPHR
ncbi:MAG: hypothetical protein IPG50_32495 [Myxococcales bacterium]|nr:hypothetical protein [Myxococcales bacterium]